MSLSDDDHRRAEEMTGDPSIWEDSPLAQAMAITLRRHVEHVEELEKHNSALKFRVTELLGVSASDNRPRGEGES